jgi:hypothetical protein
MMEALRFLFGKRHPNLGCKSRESLSQYAVRAPISSEKIRWEPEIDTVFWKVPGKGPFKNEERTFGSLDFIAQVTLL